MYLADLGKISEWKGWGGPISQAAVDARWKEIGQSPPAPLVPKVLIGLYQLPTRGPRIFGTKPKGGAVKLSKTDGKSVADFMNFWGKVAIDPYRHQSGISKVAGSILKVASIAIPAFGYMQAAADVGNAGLAISKQNSGTDEKLAVRVMTPAVDNFIANEERAAVEVNARKDAELAAQIKALQTASASALVPVSFTSPSPSPSPSTAQIQFPTSAPKTVPTNKKFFGLSNVEAAVLAAGLLGVLALSRSRS